MNHWNITNGHIHVVLYVWHFYKKCWWLGLWQGPLKDLEDILRIPSAGHAISSHHPIRKTPSFWWHFFKAPSLEEERKTLKSTLDVDLNLSQHLMSTSQVNISCQHLMSIFQLDFPFLMPSISQYLEFNIYDCYFWVGFPVSAVKYFSKFGILHLRLHFWVGFPISAVKYFSKLKFCIYDWTFGVDLDENEDEDD